MNMNKCNEEKIRRIKMSDLKVEYGNDNKAIITCVDCHEVVETILTDMVPEGCAYDKWISEKEIYHADSCEYEPDIEATCPDCGEVIAETSPSHHYFNPSGWGMMVNEAMEEHIFHCLYSIKEDLSCPDCGHEYPHAIALKEGQCPNCNLKQLWSDFVYTATPSEIRRAYAQGTFGNGIFKYPIP